MLLGRAPLRRREPQRQPELSHPRRVRRAQVDHALAHGVARSRPLRTALGERVKLEGLVEGGRRHLEAHAPSRLMLRQGHGGRLGQSGRSALPHRFRLPGKHGRLGVVGDRNGRGLVEPDGLGLFGHLGDLRVGPIHG